MRIADSNGFRRHAGIAGSVVHGADEGMRRADLIFTIGADEHEMAALGIGREHVQERLSEAGVRPLQVVDEDDDRMRGSDAERADEFAEKVVEPVQGLSARRPLGSAAAAR